VGGSCECDNKNSGSIKSGELLDWLRTCYLLKKDNVTWSYLIDWLVGLLVGWLVS
jgi:hypothetical protein